jgi:hypothetical protein
MLVSKLRKVKGQRMKKHNRIVKEIFKEYEIEKDEDVTGMVAVTS